MKIDVNGTMYDIKITGEKVKVNNKEIVMMINTEEDKIIIEGKTFHLDFIEEGEPSLMIINGMTYLVSKSSLRHTSLNEVKAPISGKIVDIFTDAESEVKEGQLLLVLEAMKMEIQIKSPVSKKIKEIKVSKGQSVRTGDVIITFV
jgi:biotin carboxyl carrier protein